MRNLFQKFRALSLINKGLLIAALLAVVFAIYALTSRGPAAQSTVKVEGGTIAETVSVTGNTNPVSSVELGFGASGNIARVYSAVGKNVSKGQVLASLNTADIDAQIKQAQSNLAQQLAENQNTTVNVDQVRKQQDQLVKNAYTKMLSEGLVAVADDASVGAEAPVITGLYNGGEGTYKIIVRHDEQPALDKHEMRTFGLQETDLIEILESEPTNLGTHGLYISFPSDLAEYDDTIWYVTIPNTTSTVYPSNYNAYQAALTARAKAIADAEAQIAAQSQGTSVAEAQVESARAALASAQAKRLNSQIIAPISGVITVFDAKVGQFASPGTPLISIISEGSFEIEAQVSETDVGKVAIGNKVTMTLDAFPDETFTGSVFYVDPAQTTTEGVVGYKIKISFDKPDARLKSGLTANVDIETRHKDDVLFLPQYAILQNDEGSFVQVLEDGKTKDIPVTLGLQDEKGNVEILSGVTEGQEVLNIGLKTK